MTIVLNKIDVDSILLDPAVSEIIHFKYGVVASLIIIFNSNLDVDNTDNALPVLSYDIQLQLGYCIKPFCCTINQFDLVSRKDQS